MNGRNTQLAAARPPLPEVVACRIAALLRPFGCQVTKSLAEDQRCGIDPIVDRSGFAKFIREAVEHELEVREADAPGPARARTLRTLETCEFAAPNGAGSSSSDLYTNVTRASTRPHDLVINAAGALKHSHHLEKEGFLLQAMPPKIAGLQGVSLVL
jgi:hypothetical protein